jgi:glycosyltransferase involved in cell wall biosynthesis
MYKLCKAQIKVGLEPIIYTGDYCFDAELAQSLKNVEFRVVKSYLNKQGFSLMPALPSVVRSEITSYSVVHMHVFRTFQNLVLYYFCRKYHVPYIIDAHGAIPYFRRKNKIKKIFDHFWGRKMLRNAACLIAETKIGVAEYISIDPTLNEEDIVVLSPPFDTEEFAILPKRGLFRKEYGIEDHEKVIMFLGRVNFIKGNDFLIKGFAELCRRRMDCRLVIVGPDDGHMAECKHLASALGVADWVIFTGFLYAEKKHSALVDADILTQMSRQEQGAWAPLEGVLCGTPIIVTSHTGAGEDVKKLDAGYLVEFDDVLGLADRMAFILDNPVVAKEKTLKAKKYIEDNLSMNKRVHEYTELYIRAINLSRS